MFEHAAVLLAAGASRRLGQAKQLLDLHGLPLIRQMALAALATRPKQLLVVLGAEISRCQDALAGLPVHIHVAHQWQQGMGASLASAVSATRPDVDGLLILGVDQPALDAQHLLALTNAWQRAPEQLVASAYAGIVGTPALFPAAWRARLSALSGDSGARTLLREAPDCQILHAPQLAIDIDDAHDLRVWRATHPAPGDPR